ncbi:beta-defensin 121 [Rousettus aegyptiacus]|uniref:Beta-defensin n=1 Tax=Rousettus aegyptiacus TaxID=9407 RepID=A0A7J8DGH4_ROUAE|nr:beta-defensin 121 [Rousettus aegyptiacus]KAF6422109.1 defensin beta 121 [Rousettus aegyptiacus]
MKLVLLVLTVTMPLAQVIPVKKCWGKLGRCRIMCEEGELFYILCNAEAKCCVNPKYVAINTGFSNYTGSLE